MSILAQISFDDIVAALIVCFAMRAVLVRALPESMAGPGGWLIDTSNDR